ncbi:MAG: hypothetical protein A2293_11060 [Elusimicrobia bacterium RIFOXYB2_FULL_49_7]|nr:MAG: hypothetical protein A2293_11060 [Elusimicrobia bacterium RIFOXYB2_FULL_49_7]
MVSKFSVMIMGVLLALFAFHSLIYSQSDEEKERKRREILEKMEKLRQQKDVLRQQEKQKIDKIDSKSKETRGESIRLFEQIVSGTQKGEERHCDALFQLGTLYYDDDRDRYAERQTRFKEDYTIWEKRGAVGQPPIEPIPDYSRSIQVYKELVLTCPTFKNRDVTLYKLGNLFTGIGDFEMAFETFNNLVKEFPKSENVPFAHLRIGEYYYMNRDNENALKHYLAVGMLSGADNYLLSLYRIASCYYNMSQFDKAIDKFFEYVELADSGKYKHADFRDEAIEYLAISFSEMEDGAENALKFFNKRGGRSYQDFIIYTIGIKNRDHDNVKEAIKSLNFLIKNFPNYVEAPMALKALTDCYVIEKDYLKANMLRQRMLNEYGPGSAWDKTYASQTERVAKTREYIRDAASMIPLYYHRLAMAQRDSGKVDNARNYMTQAITWYDKYIQKFPDEKWNVFTFHYFRADLLSDSLIARPAEAAQEFDWVSRQDTLQYPNRHDAKKKLEESEKKEERDIKNQYHSDIKEKVATVQVNPEEAGFAAVVLKERVAKERLTALKLTDTSTAGFNLPEMQDYLRYIKDFKNRFPASPHAAEVAFLEANLYFDMKKFPDAIEGYRFVVTNFPGHEKVFKPSLENLAKAYLKNKQYEASIDMYKRLYHEFSATPVEKTQMIEAIAAAMYQVAEAKQKAGDYSGSADYYKQIVIDYPDFSQCDKALFNAGYAYEAGKLYAEAGREFERVFDKFPNSSLRKDALFRSANAFREGKFYEFSAQMLLKFAKEMPSDSQAVPCIYRAAYMYDSAGNYLQSAKTYEKIYDVSLENKKTPSKYITSDREAPGAVYSAGLIYEKAKQYNEAIALYRKLATAFPTSPFTPEAVFSIAICYEKMENDRKMTEAYLNFIQKYGKEKAKVVESLMKTAKAYKRLGQRAEEDKMYRSIIDIQEKFGNDESQVLDPAYAAEAYYILGEWEYEKYIELDLRTTRTGKQGQEEVKKKLEAKTAALVRPIDLFTKCIALGTAKWTTHAVFMCGEVFWNLMEVVKSQPVLDRDPYKAAFTKAMVNEALPGYFQKAMEYYYMNIAKFGNEMGVRDEWVEHSSERYAEAWYRWGFSFVESGDILNGTPNPFPKGTQEYDEYQTQVQTKIGEYVRKCVPVFEDGIRACAEVYVNNSWVERSKKELARHAPESPAFATVFKEAPKVAPGARYLDNSAQTMYERAMIRIARIMEDNGMDIAEKISLLNSVEAGARREIERVKSEIETLKAKP